METFLLKFIFLIFISFILDKINAYEYTLPGDPGWPSLVNFTSLRSSVQGRVILRGESAYAPHTWNRMTNTPKPAVIVQPANAQDIIAALKFARAFKLRVSVQSTGHHQDHRNIYDNGVHIDMSTMTFKSIDLKAKTLTLGSGNNFSQIQAYVAQASNQTLVAACGADPGVGIYGWTAGGGHGGLTRLKGLGVDFLLSIDLLLANYTIITANSSQNQEIFRAVRGSGGGTYGIALNLTIQLHDNPGKISTFIGVYMLNNRTAEMFGKWMIAAPNEAWAYFLPQNNGILQKYAYVSAQCIGNSSFCASVFKPLENGCLWWLSLATSINCKPKLEHYANFYSFFIEQPHDPGALPMYMASTALNATNIVTGLKEAVTFINANQGTACSGNSVLGGISATIDLAQKTTTVSPEMRRALMGLTCVSVADNTSSVSVRKQRVNLLTEFAETYMKKHSTWVYWNEPQRVFPQNDWQMRYWGGEANYQRLLALKLQLDPLHVFTCYNCVGYNNSMIDPAVCPQTNCSCSNTPKGECASTPNIS